MEQNYRYTPETAEASEAITAEQLANDVLATIADYFAGELPELDAEEVLHCIANYLTSLPAQESA